MKNNLVTLARTKGVAFKILNYDTSAIYCCPLPRSSVSSEMRTAKNYLILTTALYILLVEVK